MPGVEQNWPEAHFTLESLVFSRMIDSSGVLRGDNAFLRDLSTFLTGDELLLLQPKAECAFACGDDGVGDIILK